MRTVSYFKATYVSHSICLCQPYFCPKELDNLPPFQRHKKRADQYKEAAREAGKIHKLQYINKKLEKCNHELIRKQQQLQNIMDAKPHFY